MIRSILITTTLLFLSGCVERQITQDYNSNIDDLNKFSEVKGAPPVDAVQVPKMSALCMPASVQAKDIDLIELTGMLSTLYNTSINFTGKEGLKVSLKHQNSCLRDVLAGLTETYNIGFAKVGSGYTIYPPEPMTKLFKVSYHNFERTSSSTMTVNNTNSLGDNNSNSNDNHATIETKTSDLFWENLENSIKTIITDNKALRYEEDFDSDQRSEDYGQDVTVYRESGVIVVRALPRALMKTEQFLSAINVNSLKQVIIEAKILEVELTEAYQQGIDWRALQQGTGGDYSLNMGALTLTDGAVSSTAAITKALDNTIEGHLMAGKFRSNKLGLNGIMQVLSSQGKVSVLSSPRISALNNQRALIKFGEDKYYLTGVSNTTSLANNNNSGQTISNFDLDTFFSGIALDATPKIISSEEVILHMHPMITMVSKGNVEVDTGGQKSSLPTPVIKTRETDTVVRAYSGDVIVIGGLVHNKAELNESGSPFRRPGLLNKLLAPFQNKFKSSSRAELVILLKPTIVDSLEASADFDQYTTR